MFCIICSLPMLVSDALGDHMEEALSMLIVLRTLVAAKSMCLL